MVRPVELRTSISSRHPASSKGRNPVTLQSGQCGLPVYAPHPCCFSSKRLKPTNCDDAMIGGKAAAARIEGQRIGNLCLSASTLPLEHGPDLASDAHRAGFGKMLTGGVLLRPLPLRIARLRCSLVSSAVSRTAA
jgi:hypothetical protein